MKKCSVPQKHPPAKQMVFVPVSLFVRVAALARPRVTALLPAKKSATTPAAADAHSRICFFLIVVFV